MYMQAHTRLNSSVFIFPLCPVRIQKGQVNQLKCLGGPSKDKVVLETVKSSDRVFFPKDFLQLLSPRTEFVVG